MWRKLRPYLAFAAIAFAVEGISTGLAMEGMAAQENLRSPAAQPPGWVFSVVWTLLYLLLALAMARVWQRSTGRKRRDAAAVWGVLLGIQFLWTLVFFALQARFFALLCFVPLLLCAVLTAAVFGREDRTAAWMLTPYLGWLVFAWYLNLEVWLLNR